MTSPHICLRCRSHFLRPTSRPKKQWQSRATFISLKDQQPSEGIDLPPFKKPNGKKYWQASPNGQLRNPREPRYGSRTDSRDDLLEKLFATSAESGSNPQKASSKVGEEASPTQHKPQPSSLRKLEQSIANPLIPLSDSWDLFRQHYGQRNSSGYTNPPAQDRVKLSRGIVFQNLLQSTVTLWTRRQPPAGVPMPTEAVALFQSLGIMRDQFWAETIWTMLASNFIERNDSILQDKNGGDGQQAAVDDRPRSHRLAEILEVWKKFFAAFASNTREANDILDRHSHDWSCLADVETLKSVRGGFTKDLHSRFLHIIPKFPNSFTSRSLNLAMLCTFSVLYPDLQKSANKDSLSDALQFSYFVAHLLPYADIGLPKARAHLVSLNVLSLEAIEGLLSQWEHTTQQAMTVLTLVGSRAYQEKDPNVETGNHNSDLHRNMEVQFLKRLTRTIERLDLQRAEELWLEVTHWYIKQSSALESSQRVSTATVAASGTDSLLARKCEIPLRLIHRFLTVFMALRRPERAIDVWNRMITAGQQPTAATWSAMIDGCGTARDGKALESVWQKMLASGAKPDVGCWTSRIHGLISSGCCEQGIRALEEMGNRWKTAVRKSQKRHMVVDHINNESAAKGDVGDVVKPTTVTVNATVSALLRQGKEITAQKVLQWATSYPIKFDIITFNTLLRTTFREGRFEQAQQLLGKMEAAGIKPDVVTFTMIIDSIVRNSSVSDVASSSLDTQKTITKILNEMEASGLAPNVYTYGTIIDGLLKKSSNLPATRAILNHMASRKIKSSPHINTILLTHFFSQNPPDLPGIESLWNNIRLEGGFVDFIFYDRMVEGYAKVDKTEKMMKFLIRMSQEGKSPGWEVLSLVLRALERAKDWQRLKEVIADVRSQDGLFKHGIRGMRGEEDFWRLVDEYISKGLETA